VFVLVSGSDAEARASVEDPGNLRQLHAEFRGVGDDAAGQGWASEDLARVRAHIVRS
jgi:hypothetical protein